MQSDIKQTTAVLAKTDSILGEKSEHICDWIFSIKLCGHSLLTVFKLTHALLYVYRL